MAAALDSLERLGASLAEPASAPKRRMLVIVNPFASTVSDRLRHLVVYALQGRYRVEAIDTRAKGHAIALCREAAREGYDVVVAFGGDGTINEAANGLAGSDTALACLPGGSNNVLCRMLGIPVDVVDAAERLLRIADDWQPRAIDLGVVNDRRFVFSSGVGLDASVVDRVDRHPWWKAHARQSYFAYAAVTTFLGRYLARAPQLRAEIGDRRLDGVTAIVQNGAPYTYFYGRPVHVAEGASLSGGTLAGVVLDRANLLDVPTLVWRGLSFRARMVRHRHVEGFTGATALVIRSRDDRPLPIQVDGDAIGEALEARYAVEPGALRVVA